MTEPKKPFAWKPLVILEGVTLGLGAIVGFATQKESAFYEGLVRPSFAPPGWLFPVAWTALYASMALSAWLVWRTGDKDRKLLMGLYAAQLAVNLAWPIIFFVGKALGLAFFWLVLLWLLAAIMLVTFFRRSKVAGWLLVPYQLWLTFAAVLNFTLASMN